jgi:hypothetical protein
LGPRSGSLEQDTAQNAEATIIAARCGFISLFSRTERAGFHKGL